MSPDAAAIATLLTLGIALALAFLGQIRHAGSFSAWLLTRAMRIYTLLMLRQRIHGPCPLPMEGPAIVICNHRSPVDPVLAYSASLMKHGGYSMRVLEFMTASEYCDLGGVVGWMTRTARCLPVDRNGQDTRSAKEALRRLQAGKIVGIFPEGRINTSGDPLLPFNPGVAWLALRSQAPVYPALIRNAPRGASMVGAFLKRQSADVVYGPEIDLSRWSGERPAPELLQEVAQYLQAELLRANAAAPVPAPGPVA
jgi:1-acyl-sn-glycerol-3-phosphate acyltransferase